MSIGRVIVVVVDRMSIEGIVVVVIVVNSRLTPSRKGRIAAIAV